MAGDLATAGIARRRGLRVGELNVQKNNATRPS